MFFNDPVVNEMHACIAIYKFTNSSFPPQDINYYFEYIHHSDNYEIRIYLHLYFNKYKKYPAVHTAF